jgi:carbamoyl-phosphate synthase large subunit
VDSIKNGEVHLVFNTTAGNAALSDSKSIRRAALMAKVPYYTTLMGCLAATRAIEALKAKPLEVEPLQSYRASQG